MIEVDPITRGLGRLYRYRRLLRVCAPLPIISESKKQLQEIKSVLGSRWSEVERQYPEYREIRDQANLIDQQWEKRCHGCAHWKGPPWEWQGEDLDIEEVQWCEQFKLDETSRPEECPDFSEKGDLN